jgi:hypothetical protein
MKNVSMRGWYHGNAVKGFAVDVMGVLARLARQK